MRPVIKLPSRTVAPFESENSLRHLLIEALGAYCMYCESPITLDFPVSQRISTSADETKFTVGGLTIAFSVGVGTRRFATAWVNQQVACAACVAAKGNNPGSQQGFERLYALNRPRFQEIIGTSTGRLRLDDDARDDLYIAAFQSWVWPDIAGDENGLIVLPGDDTWNLFSFDHSAKTQVELMNQGLLRLQLFEQSAAWATQSQTRLWILPNTGFIGQQQGSADLLERVKRTISGWNLNYCNPLDPAARDRRVENRTAALQTATTALNHLSNLLARLKRTQNKGDEDLEHQQVMDLLWMIRETLRSSGFWSVWAKLFAATIYNDGDALWGSYSRTARRLLLYQLFVEYEIDRRVRAPILAHKPEVLLEDDPEEVVETVMVIPGTDLNRLPF